MDSGVAKDETQPFARQADVAEEKCCRICLEEEDPETMIAPCACRGTQKYVHRACLDRWRTAREDRAFSKCTECFFEYVMVTEGEDNTGSGMRRMKYRWLVTRDFVVMFLLVQLAICSLAYMIHGIDTSGCDGHTWLPFTSTDNNEHCDPSPGEKGICGELRRTLLPCFIATHDRSSYYIFGMVVFFALVAIMGCCVGIGQSAGACDCHSGNDCYWCLWCDCHQTDCHCHGCHGCDCGNCNCNNCDVGGDGAPVLLVIAAVVCIILAFIGLIIALFFMAMVIQRVMQRHMHVLQKRTLAAHYIVRDLDGQDLSQLTTGSDRSRYDYCPVADSGAPGLVDSEMAAGNQPAPSAPSLSLEEIAELKEAGLLDQV